MANELSAPSRVGILQGRARREITPASPTTRYADLELLVEEMLFGQVRSGSALAQQAPQASAATGTEAFAGSSSGVQAVQSSSASGAEAFSGSASAGQAPQTASASGSVGGAATPAPAPSEGGWVAFGRTWVRASDRSGPNLQRRPMQQAPPAIMGVAAAAQPRQSASGSGRNMQRVGGSVESRQAPQATMVVAARSMKPKNERDLLELLLWAA